MGLVEDDHPVEVRAKPGHDLIEAGRTGDWYEAAFQSVFERLPVFACSTEGLPWTEVDTPADLEEARGLAARVEAVHA